MYYAAKLIGDNSVSNLIAFVEMIIAIIALIIGVKKVSDFIESFRNKKFDALFGYYTNLRTYIKRLRHLTVSNNSTPLGTIYKLSPVENIRESGKPGHGSDENLKLLAIEFLDYLSTANEQIPAISTKQEFDIWDKNYIGLVEILNWFSTINDSYMPSLTNEEEIKEYSRKIVKVYDYFENMMKMESDNLYKKIIP